jgi:hypothetical protein
LILQPPRSTESSFFTLNDAFLDSEYDQYQPDYAPNYSLTTTIRQPELWLKQYRQLIVGMQYLLANKEDYAYVFESIQTSELARFAAKLLTTTYDSHARRPYTRLVSFYNEAEEEPPIQSQIDALKEKISKVTTIDVHVAMSALHLISVFLFSGGTGDWIPWLNLACLFTRTVLAGDTGILPGSSPEVLLMQLDKKTLFAIKTTIWFDVLASVTTGEQPILMDLIERLFDPNTASIDGESLFPEFSMISVMGCENSVVWALAKTSQLAAWKRNQIAMWKLSVPELYAAGMQIDEVLQRNDNRSSPYCGYNGRSKLDAIRGRTAQIFRHSTRVYLHSVISGQYPYCREIRESVRATISCLERRSWNVDEDTISETQRPIVRSVVFSIFICGCLAENENDRQFLQGLLTDQNSEGVGNCYKVGMLMADVWKCREGQGGLASVPWREMLRKDGLLLV